MLNYACEAGKTYLRGGYNGPDDKISSVIVGQRSKRWFLPGFASHILLVPVTIWESSLKITKFCFGFILVPYSVQY